MLAYLLVETIIHNRQDAYYRVLADADQRADATPFIEFMLSALRDAIREAVAIDQVRDHEIDQVARLIEVMGANNELGSAELLKALGLVTRADFPAKLS